MGEVGARRSQGEGFSGIKQRHLLGEVINMQPLKKTTGKDTTLGEHLRQRKTNHMHKEFKRMDN